VFGVWYLRERTLSIHSIVTTPREGFYWLTVLVTFALGTAVGDWTIELTGWTPGISVLLPAGLIAAVLLAWRLGAGPVLSFWIAFILTRPLGANIGDFLGSSHQDGGLNLGTLGTSVLFLAAILATVLYLTFTRTDRTEETVAGTTRTAGDDVGEAATAATRPQRVLVVVDQTGLTPALLTAIRHRAATGPVQFRVVVTNPAHAEMHLLHPERHAIAAAAERVLEQAMPTIQHETGCPVLASVSIRHNPMDAIEETLHNEPVDELIVSARHHQGPRIAHHDLAHRLGHFNLPITAIESTATA